MEIRNAKYNSLGTIDCEVNHKKLGWVPFTASPNDKSTHGIEIYNAVSTVAAPYEVDESEVASLLRIDRANASMTKSEFVLACVGAGILTDVEALDVGRGDWPSAMNDFLDYLTPEQSLIARLDWDSASVINRNNVFVLSLGSFLGISDAEIDDLFGIG